ncbi:redoxin domain-containing protein [Paenibacillus sp. J2TS4]|uniref:redoxin domain-containing protein n=1 Tax=Paenibacillus sp. J2TS4 TaxID=2807194 RepID=UPI001B0C9B2B|nr:redoxin domain-containing protein [Paenibacillus sp. J2TS4]GIP32351.1 thiol-disulfide oxidoreductase ResA [Paenibacillus sp. J2TS4]
MGKYRKWMQITILSALLVLGGWTVYSAMDNSQEKARPGGPAPHFKLFDLEGKAQRLEDWKGKPVVVNFWATYCPPCREEMPDLQKQYEKWAASGVIIVGVNVGESKVTAQSFIKQANVTFPILLDSEEMIRKQYGVTEYPSTVFIRADGTIEQIKVGMMDEAFIEQSVSKLVASAP